MLVVASSFHPSFKSRLIVSFFFLFFLILLSFCFRLNVAAGNVCPDMQSRPVTSYCYRRERCDGEGNCLQKGATESLCNPKYEECTGAGTVQSPSRCVLKSALSAAHVCQLSGSPATDPSPTGRTFGCSINSVCYPFNTPRNVDSPCIVSSVPGAAVGQQCTGAWVELRGVGKCDCTGKAFSLPGISTQDKEKVRHKKLDQSDMKLDVSALEAHLSFYLHGCCCCCCCVVCRCLRLLERISSVRSCSHCSNWIHRQGRSIESTVFPFWTDMQTGGSLTCQILHPSSNESTRASRPLENQLSVPLEGQVAAKCAQAK